ncbi:MAG TPA: hypothetical protein VNL91_04220 [Thermoanaerobaculia bacterium]|nr:hypothetical protein [Thermoanaerobaculia bacterium]
MKRFEVLERARHAAILARAIPQPIIYVLGKGGFDPGRHVPWNRAGECDCSGFLAWTIREPREHPALAWIESTNVFRDATGPQVMFMTLPAGERAEPGDVLVTPDKGDRQGHVAIITAVAPDGAPSRMIDCSPSNDRVGAAIAERQIPPAFGSAATVVRLRGIH